MSDSSTLLLILSGAVLLTVLAISIILFLVQYNRRQLIHVLEKEALQHHFEKQLLQARLATQEQSFEYFSEEIHDNVGQILSVVGIKLYQLQELSSTEQARGLAAQSSELVGKAITDLRGMSEALHSQYIDKAGLIEALRQEIVHINSTRSTGCSLVVNGVPRDLGKSRETLLHSILREAIANALHHARANHIHVVLNFQEAVLSATVEDDGIGFDGDKGGTGLANLRLRTELLEGTLKIESRSGSGTKLGIQIPITDQNESRS